MRVIVATVVVLAAAVVEVVAQDAVPGQPTTAQFLFGTLQFIAIGFFVYYMLVILPRSTQENERKKFLSNLKKGDEVVTTGGLIGKVAQIKDDAITLELSSSVKVRVLPQHVQSRSQGSGATASTADKKKTANN